MFRAPKLCTYDEVSPVPLLLRREADPVADHDGVLVAEVVGHALGAGGALGLDTEALHLVVGWKEGEGCSAVSEA